MRLAWLLGLAFVLAALPWVEPAKSHRRKAGAGRRNRRKQKHTSTTTTTSLPPSFSSAAQWDKLATDKNARARFLRKVQDYSEECAAQFRAGASEEERLASPPMEHEMATFNFLKVCAMNDKKSKESCTPDTLVFALHTLSLMQIRNAQYSVCCRTEAMYPLRRLKFLRSSALESPSALALRLSEVLHSLAAHVASEKGAHGGNVDMIRSSDRDGRWSSTYEMAARAAEGAHCSADVSEDWVFQQVMNPIDVDALRQERIRNGGWVHIKDLLHDDFVDALHKHLAALDKEDWHQSTWHYIPGNPESEMAFSTAGLGPKKTPWTDEMASQLMAEYSVVDEAGLNGHFAYSHLRSCGGASMCPVSRETRKRCPWTPPAWLERPIERNVTLCDLEAAMGSRSFRRIVATIMGLPALGGKFQDFFASWYRKGDFLTNHTDSGLGRRIAFRLSLTPNELWQEEWGGNLYFDSSSKVGERPFLHWDSFNSMLLLDVRTSDTAHYVTNVTEDAPDEVKRLAVTGWY